MRGLQKEQPGHPGGRGRAESSEAGNLRSKYSIGKAPRFCATGVAGRWNEKRREFFAEHFCDIGEWFAEFNPADARRTVVWGEIRDRWDVDETRYGFPVLLKSRSEARAALAAAEAEAQAFLDRWLDPETQTFASDEVIQALGSWS